MRVYELSKPFLNKFDLDLKPVLPLFQSFPPEPEIIFMMQKGFLL